MMQKPRLKKITAAISVGLMLAGPLQTTTLAYAEDGGRDDGGSRFRRGKKAAHRNSDRARDRSQSPRTAASITPSPPYQAKHGQTVSNLLSKGIVRADGTPGPNFGLGAQFTVPPQPIFYISATSKTPYPHPARRRIRTGADRAQGHRTAVQNRGGSGCRAGMSKPPIRSSSPPARPACRCAASIRA